MESIWQPKSRYFTIIPVSLLETVLTEEDLLVYGYPPVSGMTQNVIDHYEIEDSITLDMVLNVKKYLANDLVAVSIQIRPYNNFITPSSSVRSWITEDDFNKALEKFGATEFLTTEEFKNLEPINEIE